ncbi:MAG: hypothetical protein QOF48_3951, partial [Verrucomicrobiota bacterium]
LQAWSAAVPEPLRVFLRCGPKTHGPGEHDGPTFLTNWTRLLTERGVVTSGAIAFPNAAELEACDVLVMYSAEGGAIPPADRANLEAFLKRGGGIVVLHDSVCGDDPQWWKTVIGGAWEHGHSKWFEGNVPLYFTEQSHPIIEGVSNWDFDDEIYWDLHLTPDAKVLCSSYAPDKRNTRAGRALPSIYEIVPQMWVVEKKAAKAGVPYRAFVSIPGHKTKSFSFLPYRAVLLRGIAWAGKRDIDSLCQPEELASLRYHEGGPTEPAKSAPLIKAHPDFALKLVASEPLISKPISLDWDPAGRLWVAETPEYPFRRTAGGPPHDRISILEDANGDGVMDRKSVFFEGLHLVTSFVFHRDGVIVAQAPDILWLRDTDHDGHADKIVKLFSGFGTNDTHAVLSNFRWGPDGWIYATIGYSRGDIYSGDRAKHFGPITDGVFRFRPDGSAIEQVCSKASNTWGVDIATDGEIFFSQANGNHVNHVVLTESALSRGKVSGATSYKTIEDHKKSFPLRDYAQQAYVQIDFVGGFTAASGACLYDGGAWPEMWNNAFFVTEPTVNLLHADFLRADGSTYLASKEPTEANHEFLASTDLWFRPIHARVGPDGGLYVLDFYNQAAVHNDTRGPQHSKLNNAAIRPDRDHYFGRIWQVQHRDARKPVIPRLDKSSITDLAAALAHPNGWVRQTAARLLVEKADPATADALLPLVSSLGFRGLEQAKAQALWVLHQLGKLSPELLAEAIATDGKPDVQKSALRIAAEVPPAAASLKRSRGTIESAGGGSERSAVRAAVLKRARDLNPRVRLEAFVTLATLPATDDARALLVDLWTEFPDPWLQSAAIGVAAQAPVGFIDTAANVPHAGTLTNLVAQLTAQFSRQPDAASNAARVVVVLAGKSDAADPLKRVALETLARELAADALPEWSDPLKSAFQSLFAESSAIASAALPLAVRWDTHRALKDDVKTLVTSLLARLKEESRPDDARAQLATSLIAVRSVSAHILPAITNLLGGDNSAGLQRKAIDALGTITGSDSGKLLISVLPRLTPALQEAAFAQLLKRTEGSLALLDALNGGMVKLSSLGPGFVHRLRTHTDKAVAARATEVIAALRGPDEHAKEALIAKFTPEVIQPGNVESGHQLFTKNCAVCHKFNGEGKETGPDLTGMGAHGPAELLVHVLDPNRVVEPNYVAVNIETRDDQSFTGIIARESKSSVVLRDANGENEIKTDDIQSRASSGRSLMPEGFETLGAAGLRDLLAFVCTGESRFRVLDLSAAITADGTHGIFESEERTAETLVFKSFGLVKAGEVPFQIVNPARASNGKNLVVLRGGGGFAKTLARKVEIADVLVRATRLHFLGGVGAGAWPCCGSNKNEGLPVARVSVLYTDGQQEQFYLTNGVEFVDYSNVDADVSGSKRVPGVLARGQIRAFSRALTGKAPIEKIALESFDNSIVPVFVAITAETGAKPEPSQGSRDATRLEKRPAKSDPPH